MEDIINAKFTSYQKLIIFVLAILQFTVVLDFTIISPIGDILIKTLNITTKQFGFAVSSYAFSAAASGIIAAGFMDKFDRKKALIFFYTGFIIGTLFCALSNTYISLLIARIFTGFFGGVISSIVLTIISDLFMPHQRGRAMSFVQMAFAGSQILGIPFGLFIANKLGWHYTFFLIVILALIVLLIIIFKLKSINEHLKIVSDKKPILHLWHTVKNKKYQVGFLGITFLSIGGYMIMPFMTIYLVNNIHIASSNLPIIFMITGLSSLVMMPIVGKLSDKYSKLKIFLFGTFTSIIMIAIYTNLPIVPLWSVVVINVIMFASIMSRMVPFQALNSMMPNKEGRGAYMSISSSLQQIAGGLGAVISGFVIIQKSKTSPLENFNVLGYLAIAIAILCAYFVFRVYKLTIKK
ncbi:MFS transporter [Flavobacterium psychrophilum]|uniref:Major facilitator superfamily (MFS) permease n=1 Tax=Flavobacterium psychrophilum (strain ATCC 49511 / DSM 21280 / CIP 103535 / JIP02/86) TaxID=402612 RepID=A6GZT6_FLAPJ|nr:MFS transporter [Flavobacterium psychrophilum]AIG30306.1 MFS transporter [Flavobacterium psychrophilum]AIG32581.1 MFS transporter [Flavobacterium psychrophilum]AIG34736.1 MFS transporter [Flavobacterium psychrophilum]AIG37101.1 MFS transporter [Flavobacterium psychrophilum]AIG39365.1 MFS transporter [Flavobacterium psychrophilum]